MRILVVAEELQVIQELKTMAAGIDSNIEVIGSTNDLASSVDELPDQNLPDLVLINKDQDKVTDNRSFIKSRFKTTITFSTAASEYTFGAFHIEKKDTTFNHPLPAQPPVNYRKRFLARHGQRFQAIDICRVAYFFSKDQLIFLQTKDNQQYLIEYRMEELEQMLDPNDFFRVNQGFLISINAIGQVHPYPGNRLWISPKPTPDKEVIISRERVSEFRLWLGE